MLIKTKFSGYTTDGLRTYPKGSDGSKQMRQQEEERQARINAAVETINGVFNGKPQVEVAGRASSFAPGQTYYDQDGNEFVAPSERYVTGSRTKTSLQDRNRGYGSTTVNTYGTRMDDDAIAKAVQDGLYTERKTVAPAPREQLYTQQKQAVTDINKLDVDKQYKVAERNARFGLSRQGLLGGSEDINANEDLRERQNKGLIQAAALGDSAAAELKNQDERARQSLISMAQSGIDTGTAQSMAMKQLDAAAQAASGNAKVATIGDLFGDMSQAWMLNQKRQGMASGQALAQNGQNFGAGNVRSGDSGNINR